MANKKIRKGGLILALCMTLLFGSSINAYAYVDESAGTESTTEAVEVKEELTTDTKEEKKEDTKEEKDKEGAFSESGNMSLLDDVGSDAAKELEYMTVQTRNGKVFYLVIDRSTDTENVYFLNQVDAADLMAIMEDSEKEAYENSKKDEVVDVPETPVEEPEEPTEVPEIPKEEPQTDNLALLGVIGVVSAAVIGGYVLMKKKGKKDGTDLEDDLEFYDDEEYENEDEPEFAQDEEDM